MKILLMSDSHGNKKAIYRAIENELPELVLHLGDHNYDCSDAIQSYPEITFRTVRGNCDRFSPELETDEFTINDMRFIMTHGNLFGVKTGYSRIISFAAARNANVLLFGHTHIPYYSVIEGLTVINPGSVGMDKKTYAVLQCCDGVLSCEHKHV